MGVFDAHERGVLISAEMKADIEAAQKEREERISRNTGKLALMGIHGTISPRPSLFTSGGTNAEQLQQHALRLAADKEVAEVVIDVDTPGGSVFGIAEAAAALRKLASAKPVTAVVNHNAHSAGYYLAAQATSIVASPSSYTGSIGVILPIVDKTKATEKEGIEVTYVHAGKYKAEGYQAPTDEYVAHVQSLVDSYYEDFIQAVAEGRGIEPDEVEEKFGQGRSFRAKDALERGMVDRIGTLDEIIAEKMDALRQKDRERRVRVLTN